MISTQAKNNYQNEASILKIGRCVVRPSQNVIECAGDSTRISPRAMDTLVYLAARAGEVVSGDELINAVWRGRVVNDAQIYKIVSELRRAFRHHSNEEPFIQTVPKRGYRLVATVTPAESSASAPATAFGGMSSHRKLGFVASGVLVLMFLVIVGRFLGEQRRPLGEVISESFGSTAAVREGTGRGLVGPLAVLPFDSLSSDADDVYFAAGIHEEILNQVGKLTALSVVSRSSIQPYSGEKRSVSEVAAEMRAGSVLVGSVLHAANRVRIYTQLFDVGTDSQIWSATYERNLDDTFAIQTDIATRVASALEAQLSFDVPHRQEQRLTESPEAYAFYLRAGEAAVTPGLPNAVRHLYLDQAIALDPEFAQAHARKADVYAAGLVGNYASGLADVVDLDEMDSRVRISAATALALDPDLESAYLALGRLHQYRWRWADAQEAYERAFELAHNNPDVLRAFASFASHMGDHISAIALATRTTELIPTQSGGRFRLGTSHLYAGDHDSAAAAFRKTLELDPSHSLANVYLAILQGVRGNSEEAIMELKVAERTLNDDPLPHIIALIAYGYSRAEFMEDTERLARRVETMSVDQPVGDGTCTFIALAHGNEEQSLACLYSAVEAIENQIPDVSYHNLMLVIANVFSDPILERPSLRAIRNQAYARFALRDDIQLTGELQTRVPATR